MKRAKYIERNCELMQEFWFAHPQLKCKLNKIYNSSFPGSVLWDFTSDSVSSIINSWSVSVRLMWDLPRQTHRKFIESLSGVHAKTMLYSRFVKFIQSITHGEKAAPIYIYEIIKNNTQTITGRNIKLILNELDKRCIEKVTIEEVKSKIRLKELPEEEMWKIHLIKELTNVKQNILFIDIDNGEDILARN